MDYTKGPLETEIKDVDVVIDTVGGETVEKSIRLLKKGGVLVTVAGQISEEKAKEHGAKALRSGRGPTEKLKVIGEMAAAKTLRAEVGKIFPLAEAGAAQDLSQTRHGRGRLLLKVQPQVLPNFFRAISTLGETGRNHEEAPTWGPGA